MAYYCECCRLATEKCYANCPSCGGGLTQDSRSCDDFSRAGYRIIGRPAPSAEQTSSRAGNAHIRDDDMLAQLRRGYRESFQQNDAANVASFGYGSEHAQEHRERPDPVAESFFARYSRADATSHQEPAPHREEPVYIPPEPLPRTHRRPHLDLSGIGYGLSALLRAIPWRLVFTLLILAAVGGVVMTIWNMRYVIISSILGFLIDLIPIFLIIGAIAYLIKSIFR